MKATELASLLLQRAEKYGDFHVLFVMKDPKTGKQLQRIVSEVNVLSVLLPTSIDKEGRTQKAVVVT